MVYRSFVIKRTDKITSDLRKKYFRFEPFILGNIYFIRMTYIFSIYKRARAVDTYWWKRGGGGVEDQR